MLLCICLCLLLLQTVQVKVVSSISISHNKNAYSNIIKDQTTPLRIIDDTSFSPTFEKRTLRDFLTAKARKLFVRRVYSIFIVQMLATIMTTGLAMHHTSFFQSNLTPLTILATFGSLVSVLMLVMSPKTRYSSPLNYIVLGIHTICNSLNIASFSTLFDPEKIFLGTMHTLTVLIAITLYTFQPNPNLDLTLLGNTLFCLLSSLTAGSIIALFTNLPWMDNLLSGAMAILFGVYIAYDTSKIVGGKHVKNPYSEKEYILAALNLYQDVLNLFMRIVQILDKMDNKRKKH